MFSSNIFILIFDIKFNTFITSRCGSLHFNGTMHEIISRIFFKLVITIIIIFLIII
jgi:hypothetical protein